MRRLLLLMSVGLLAVSGSLPTADPGRRAPLVDVPDLDPKADQPRPDQLQRLARTDAVAFLRATLHRYRQEVHGYRAVLQKQERFGDKLGPVETIDVWFREEPFSALLKWTSASASLTDRALYVAGANNNQVLARGKLLHFVHSRDPYGPDARASSRYPMPEFGLAKGTERTLNAWLAAEGRGNLKTEYLGVRTIPEAGGVACYVLRCACDPPEADGVSLAEVAFDTDHWLQVANVLKGPDGQLVGAYYFRDFVLNPDFPPGQFERAALSRD